MSCDLISFGTKLFTSFYVGLPLLERKDLHGGEILTTTFMNLAGFHFLQSYFSSNVLCQVQILGLSSRS